MSIEELFRAIKQRCDGYRILANGTGRPMIFTITKDGVHHCFTIGAKSRFGGEFLLVIKMPKVDAEHKLLNLIDLLISQKMFELRDAKIELHEQLPIAIRPIQYDKVNIALSGMLAAVYGTETNMRQVFISDHNGRLPNEPGYRDNGLKQFIYTN